MAPPGERSAAARDRPPARSISAASASDGGPGSNLLESAPSATPPRAPDAPFPPAARASPRFAEISRVGRRRGRSRTTSARSFDPARNHARDLRIGEDKADEAVLPGLREKRRFCVAGRHPGRAVPSKAVPPTAADGHQCPNMALVPASLPGNSTNPRAPCRLGPAEWLDHRRSFMSTTHPLPQRGLASAVPVG